MIGAIPSVTNIDIFYAGKDILSVSHVTKSTEFVLVMDRLKDGIRINMPLKVKKGI